MRVLAYWQRGRYLELAATRARLDPDELGLQIGSFTVLPADLSAASHCATGLHCAYTAMKRSGYPNRHHCCWQDRMQILLSRPAGWDWQVS